MTSTVGSAIAPEASSFDARVKGVRVPKNAMNVLILEYLTMEGYADAAAKFSKEANIKPYQPEEDTRAREAIQLSILRGNIKEAIESLNELDPEILDNDQVLNFALLRLELVELIRVCNKPGGDVMQALGFATAKLGPIAPTHPKFVEDLEKTMSLLVFPHDENLDPSLAAILDVGLRQEVADSVNKAILMQQYGRREAALKRLVRMRQWAAEEAMKTGDKNVPSDLTIKLGRPENYFADDAYGPDPMITN